MCSIYMLDAFYVLHVLTHLISIIILKGRYYDWLHFVDEETEALRD